MTYLSSARLINYFFFLLDSNLPLARHFGEIKRKKRLFITYIILKHVLQIFMSQSKLAFVGLVMKVQKCLHNKILVK